MAALQNFYNREDSRWLEVVAYTCCLNVHAVPTIGRISKFFRCFFLHLAILGGKVVKLLNIYNANICEISICTRTHLR